MPIILGFALMLLLAAVLVPQMWIRRVFARHGARAARSAGDRRRSSRATCSTAPASPT